MYVFNFISIVLVHCVCILTTGTYGYHFGSGHSIWNHAITNGDSLLEIDESLMKFLHDDWDREPGCNCLNGKCESLCVKEKNGLCLKTGNVCICDAEFFKVNDETCIYCGCGKGFNCTFYHTARSCSCPEGFYVRDNKCAAMCGESHPCQNGGTCNKGKCECKGGTSGIFCESSDWCKKNCNKPLSTECVYNEERKDMDCFCKDKSLVYDFEERICKPCPCKKGTCEVKDAKLACKCDAGFSSFNKQCIPCDCGRGGICQITDKGEKTCKCKDGDLSRGEKCLPCDCGHQNATCKSNKEGRKVCICPYGYEDILGKCIKMNKDDRRCLCHPTANCIETFDEVNEFNCSCNEGYKGKVHDIPLVGEECIDVDECRDSKTCPNRETMECVNFEGSFTCRCKTGYQPSDMSADSRKLSCESYKMSWAPTGVVIGIIVAFIAISVGVLLFLKKKSLLFSSTPGIEMQHADFKRIN